MLHYLYNAPMSYVYSKCRIYSLIFTVDVQLAVKSKAPISFMDTLACCLGFHLKLAQIVTVAKTAVITPLKLLRTFAIIADKFHLSLG